MAARKKLPPKVKTVENNEYTALEMHAIKLNEYYKALRTAGFASDLALTIMMDEESHPEWFFGKEKIADLLKEEDED